MTNYMDNYLNWLESTTPEERLGRTNGKPATETKTSCPECQDTGMVWTEGCNCGVGPHGYYGMHERHCGAEPCPAGCPVKTPAIGEAAINELEK